MEKTLKERIIKLLSFTHGLSKEEIQDEISSTEEELENVLNKLVSTCILWKNEKEIYSTLENEGMVYGIFLSNEKGFGFVKRINSDGEDIYVDERDKSGAIHHDKVIIRVKKMRGKSDEGKVIKIVERGVKRIVGTFKTDAKGMYVLPDDKKMPLKLFVSTEDSLGAVPGHKVVAYIRHYLGDGNLRGEVTEIIGHENDPGVDILSIVHKYGINIEFSEESLAAANAIPDTVSEDEIAKRRDLRDEMIITIDGEDAKDLDDAVGVTLLPNGNYKLGVHIADVSYYVSEGSALDIDAQERGTSVYLVDRVIPMIPHRLSNGICSLNPKVDRLTLSCVMEFTPQGILADYEIFDSVIKTTERMTYSNVRKILLHEDESVRREYNHIVPMIEEMGQLAEILRKRRFDGGSIDFDVKEAKILVDENCQPTEIVERDRSVAEKLIEDFMLAANDTVAMHIRKLELPFVYRIHEKPSPAKLHHFANFITGFGYRLTGDVNNIQQKVLQEFLDDMKDKKEETIVSKLLLRSMQQAKYSPDSLGHFGLAKEFYTHFTSPIRRYPDLIVHRLIREYLIYKKQDEKTKQHYKDILGNLADHASGRERRAIEAERETVEKKKTEFMKDKIGERYVGIISSVTKFGMFVELPNTIEGLIHVSSLTDDHYEFDEKRLCLIGKRKKKVYNIGETLNVVLKKADLKENRLYFEVDDKKISSKNKKEKETRKSRFDSIYK